jgi:hypothetical protein
MRDLKGAVRLIHEGIEYGFPIVILDDTITVEIPALEKIIKEDLKDNTPIEAKLEIIADDVFSTPWADTIRVERPIKVEATLQEVEELQEKIKPNIKAKIVAELESRPEKKKILKEEKPEVVKIVPKWLK